MSDKSVYNIAILLSLAAFSLLGAVVGRYIGLGGSDAVLLSAVLPTVLTLIGGALVFKSEKMEGRNRDSDIRAGVISFSVILFLITLMLGTRWGLVERDEAEDIEKREALQDCIQLELWVNNQRQKFALSPLTTEAICDL